MQTRSQFLAVSYLGSRVTEIPTLFSATESPGFGYSVPHHNCLL